MGSQPDAPRSTTPSARPYHQASAWVGWIAFAAVCLSLLGAFHVVQGVAALVDADYFPVTGHGPITDISLTAWGWVHLIGGVILIVAGLCVFAGQTWARTVGVLVAAVSLVTSFGFLGAYPALALVMIALGVVVILALTVHGSDIKP
jgi:hypothetical protein